MSNNQWIKNFSGLFQLSPEIQSRLTNQSQIVHLNKGETVFAAGKAPENYLLLIEGIIRVQQVSESGREIVLYRVNAGESCPLTTACLMSYEEYLAEAIVEEDATAVAIPKSVFDELIGQSVEFRQFVFNAFSTRVTNLFRIIDEIAFMRMDIRLAQKLLALSQNTNQLTRTHQQLAAELGSAREVISRQMQEFQRRGWVASKRGEITIIDHAALEHLAHSV